MKSSGGMRDAAHRGWTTAARCHVLTGCGAQVVVPSSGHRDEHVGLAMRVPAFARSSAVVSQVALHRCAGDETPAPRLRPQRLSRRATAAWKMDAAHAYFALREGGDRGRL